MSYWTKCQSFSAVCAASNLLLLKWDFVGFSNVDLVALVAGRWLLASSGFWLWPFVSMNLYLYHRKIISVQKMVVKWVEQRMTAHQMIIERS
jgi:hypothetical protein